MTDGRVIDNPVSVCGSCPRSARRDNQRYHGSASVFVKTAGYDSNTTAELVERESRGFLDSTVYKSRQVFHKRAQIFAGDLNGMCPLPKWME